MIRVCGLDGLQLLVVDDFYGIDFYYFYYYATIGFGFSLFKKKGSQYR